MTLCVPTRCGSYQYHIIIASSQFVIEAVEKLLQERMRAFLGYHLCAAEVARQSTAAVAFHSQIVWMRVWDDNTQLEHVSESPQRSLIRSDILA